MYLFILLLLLAAILAAALFFYFRSVIRKNDSFLKRVEAERQDQTDIRTFLTELNFMFDDPSREWEKVFEKEGIEIFNTFTQQQYTGGRGVRTYRVISYLDASRLSVDRMVELLNGGFLTEDLWFKDDFQGGQRLREVEEGEQQNAWIAQYVSDLQMPPLQLRDFVYLLARRELDRDEYSMHDHDGKEIVRQVVLGYQSISHPPLRPKIVRATQFPSLDRITLYKDELIKWEHIMAFHVNGVLSLGIVNGKYKAACNVLYHEAANMRNYLSNQG